MRAAEEVVCVDQQEPFHECLSGSDRAIYVVQGVDNDPTENDNLGIIFLALFFPSTVYMCAGGDLLFQ